MWHSDRTKVLGLLWLSLRRNTPSIRPCWVIRRWASSRDSFPWNHGWAKWIAMFGTELCAVEGLPWPLKRWQLFLLQVRPSSTATDSASDGFSITRLFWPEKSMATSEFSEMLLIGEAFCFWCGWTKFWYSCIPNFNKRMAVIQQVLVCSSSAQSSFKSRAELQFVDLTQKLNSVGAPCSFLADNTE